MTGTYTISLKNCSFFAYHGFYPEEAVLGQRFYVDAEFDVEAAAAAERDELEGTVDYGLAFKVIEETVLTEKKRLIEALAVAISKALLLRFPEITRVKISVRKPSAPIQGVLDYVEVTVEDRR